MSLLIVLTLSLVGGAPALSDVNIWQALDLGMVLLSGVVSFVNVSWYLRYREALMLVRWTSTILINTALMLPVLTSSNTASMAGSLATVGASCLLFASISPLRFSTLVPLLVVQVLATASSLPKVCHATFLLCLILDVFSKTCSLHSSAPRVLAARLWLASACCGPWRPLWGWLLFPHVHFPMSPRRVRCVHFVIIACWKRHVLAPGLWHRTLLNRDVHHASQYIRIYVR